MTRTTLLAALTVLSLTGCSYATRQRPMRAADAATPEKTRLTNYLSAPRRPGQPVEQAPGGINRSAVEDEAQITKLDAKEVCFTVLARTNTVIDEPLSHWNVEVSGSRVYVDRESEPKVFDYAVTGEREVVSLAAVGIGNLRVTQPATRTFRVVERTAAFCGPAPQPGQPVRLELVLPQDDSLGHYGQVFEWQVAD